MYKYASLTVDGAFEWADRRFPVSLHVCDMGPEPLSRLVYDSDHEYEVMAEYMTADGDRETVLTSADAFESVFGEPFESVLSGTASRFMYDVHPCWSQEDVFPVKREYVERQDPRYLQ